jgi:hypothetical protein
VRERERKRGREREREREREQGESEKERREREREKERERERAKDTERERERERRQTGTAFRMMCLCVMSPIHPMSCHMAWNVSRKYAKQFRGGLVVKVHRLLYHSTLGSRGMKKKKKVSEGRNYYATAAERARHT